MCEPKVCGIPANGGMLGYVECDEPYGHAGDLHSNAGDGYYARQHDAEHHRRQAEMGTPPQATGPNVCRATGKAHEWVTGNGRDRDSYHCARCYQCAGSISPASWEALEARALAAEAERDGLRERLDVVTKAAWRLLSVMRDEDFGKPVEPGALAGAWDALEDLLGGDAAAKGGGV